MTIGVIPWCLTDVDLTATALVAWYLFALRGEEMAGVGGRLLQIEVLYDTF